MLFNTTWRLTEFHRNMEAWIGQTKDAWGQSQHLATAPGPLLKRWLEPEASFVRLVLVTSNHVISEGCTLGLLVGHTEVFDVVHPTVGVLHLGHQYVMPTSPTCSLSHFQFNGPSPSLAPCACVFCVAFLFSVGCTMPKAPVCHVRSNVQHGP